MTLADLRAMVERRREEFARLDAHVAGAALCDELLASLDLLEAPEPAGERLLTLGAAARAAGFSPGHFSRLVRRGEIPNYGRARAPRLKLSECPQKTPRVAKRARSTASSTTQRARVMPAARPGLSLHDANHERR